MRLLLLALLTLGCETQTPVALPDRMHTAPKGKGRAIRHNGVHGYIARPSDSTVRPAVASLHLVPVVNESARLRAIEHAGTGKIVLSIPPSTDTQAALTYLKGLPTITEVSSVCYRTKC